MDTASSVWTAPLSILYRAATAGGATTGGRTAAACSGWPERRAGGSVVPPLQSPSPRHVTVRRHLGRQR